MTEVWERDAWELADAVRSGAQRSTELLDVFVERVEKFNPELNAFCYLDLEGARARAAAIDDAVARGDDPGVWAGVPMGVKELVVGGGLARHARIAALPRHGRHARRHRAGAAQGRGRGARRAHDLARVRFDQLDAYLPARHDAQPVEPGAHAGRLVGRFRGGGRVGDDADLHGQRRRRLDPHPVLVQRAVRLQDELRPRGLRAATSTARLTSVPGRCAGRCATRRATSTRSRARPTTTRRRCRARRVRTRTRSSPATRSRSCAASAPRGRRRSGSRCAIPRSRSSPTRPRSRCAPTPGIELVDVDVQLPAAGRRVGIDLLDRHRGRPSRRRTRSLGRRHAGVAGRAAGGRRHQRRAADAFAAPPLRAARRDRCGVRRGRPPAHADDRDDRVRRRGPAADGDRRAEGRRHGIGPVHRAVQHLGHARREHSGRLSASDGLPVGLQVVGRRDDEELVLGVRRDRRGQPPVAEVRARWRTPDDLRRRSSR